MTFSVFRRTLMASALGLVSLSVQAQAANRFDVSDTWKVAAVSQGQGASCEIKNRYDNGFDVSFVVKNGAVSQLVIDMKQDIFTAGEGYNASFDIDGHNIGNHTGGAKNAQTLAFDMSEFDGFIDAASNGQSLGVNVEKNPFSFSLDKFDVALSGQQDCLTANTGQSQPMMAASADATTVNASEQVQMDLFEQNSQMQAPQMVQNSLKDREVYVRRHKPEVAASQADDLREAQLAASIQPAAGEANDVPEVATPVAVKRHPEPIDLLKMDVADTDVANEADKPILVSRASDMQSGEDLQVGKKRPDQMARFEGDVQSINPPQPAAMPQPVQAQTIAQAPSQETLSSVPSVDVPVKEAPQVMQANATPLPVQNPAVQQADIAKQPYEPIRPLQPYEPITREQRAKEPLPSLEPQVIAGAGAEKAQQNLPALKQPVEPQEIVQAPEKAEMPAQKTAPQMETAAAAKPETPVAPPKPMEAKPVANAAPTQISDPFLMNSILAAKAEQDAVVSEPLPPMIVAEQTDAQPARSDKIMAQQNMPTTPVEMPKKKSVATSQPMAPAVMHPGLKVAKAKPVAPEGDMASGVKETQRNAVIEKLYRLERGGVQEVKPQQGKLADIQDVLDASTMAEIPIRVVRSDDIFVSRPAEPAETKETVEMASSIEASVDENTSEPVKREHVDREPQDMKPMQMAASRAPQNIAPVNKEAVQEKDKPMMATWQASAGEDMKDVLERWAKTADVDFRWEADESTKLSQDIEVNGDLQAAVQLLMAQNGQDVGLSGNIVDDTAAVQSELPKIASNNASVKMPAQPVELVAARSNGKSPSAWAPSNGGSLRDTLEQWSRRENVNLIWRADRDFSVLGTPPHNQSFDEAVATVLQGYSDDPVRPVGQLNIDPSTGQKLLIIEVERIL